ncbi:unnamed protein product [Porites evermanni]|uniref:Uncharacterized protein n=1 Tax=Porites evermanni TaxID=104178 RepID=A0ABN8QY54_9CNID|nr:unnamed protein product [Porites evermanni]
MRRLFACLIVLCVLSNVKSYDLYEKLIAAVRSLEQALANEPIEVQERMLSTYLTTYAKHLPSSVQLFNVYEDTSSDGTLGAGRSVLRKSNPWENIRRRYVANSKDDKRFQALMKELEARESRMPENKFRSEIEGLK